MPPCYTRIRSEDLLNPDHYLVFAIFSRLSDNDFMDVLGGATKETGFGGDSGGCLFPNDINPGDEPIPPDSVECGVPYRDDVLVLSFEEYYYYLEKYALNYIKDCPQVQDIVEGLRDLPRIMIPAEMAVSGVNESFRP